MKTTVMRNRFFWWTLILVAAGLIATQGAYGSGQERIQLFESDVIVQRNGSLKVRDTLHVYNAGDIFGRGVQMAFTEERRDQHGNSWRVDYSDFVVVRDGVREPFSLARQQDQLLLQTSQPGPALSLGEHTYEISYVTAHQIQQYDETEELEYQPLGTWQVPIERFQVDFSVPEAIPTNKVDAIGYTTATALQLFCSCTHTVDSHGLQTFVGSLQSSGEFIVRVNFPSGFLIRPPGEELRLWIENHKTTSAIGIFILSVLVNSLIALCCLRFIPVLTAHVKTKTDFALFAGGIAAPLSLISMGVYSQPFSGMPGSGVGLLLLFTVQDTSARYLGILVALVCNFGFYYVTTRLALRWIPWVHTMRDSVSDERSSRG